MLDKFCRLLIFVVVVSQNILQVQIIWILYCQTTLCKSNEQTTLTGKQLSGSECPHARMQIWRMYGSREGETGGSGPPPPEKSQHIGFISNIGPDPLENHKATKLAFNVYHQRPASETPFKWRFAGGTMMARFKWVFGSSHRLKNVKIGLPLPKLSVSAHVAKFASALKHLALLSFFSHVEDLAL